MSEGVVSEMPESLRTINVDVLSQAVSSNALVSFVCIFRLQCLQFLVHCGATSLLMFYAFSGSILKSGVDRTGCRISVDGQATFSRVGEVLHDALGLTDVVGRREEISWSDSGKRLLLCESEFKTGALTSSFPLMKYERREYCV